MGYRSTKEEKESSFARKRVLRVYKNCGNKEYNNEMKSKLLYELKTYQSDTHTKLHTFVSIV